MLLLLLLLPSTVGPIVFHIYIQESPQQAAVKQRLLQLSKVWHPIFVHSRYCNILISSRPKLLFFQISNGNFENTYIKLLFAQHKAIEHSTKLLNFHDCGYKSGYSFTLTDSQGNGQKIAVQEIKIDSSISIAIDADVDIY
jgi:hypothetical protein